jgi:hypothetical protein
VGGRMKKKLIDKRIERLEKRLKGLKQRRIIDNHMCMHEEKILNG